jgi:hypothetical protein
MENETSRPDLDQHGPTAETVRDRYVLAAVNDTDFPGWTTYKARHDADFDAWLAKVQTEAWTRGWKDRARRNFPSDREPADPHPSFNPYRSTEGTNL